MFFPNQTIYQNKIWYGQKTEPRFSSNNSIGSVLYEALTNNPEQISQICYPSNKIYKNKEIFTLSIRIAQHLESIEEKLKLQQNSVIGICAGNSDFVAPLVFACMFRGLIVSTSDPNFDKNVLKHIYSNTKPKLMFCDGSVYYKVKETFAECGLKSTKIFTTRDHIDGVPSLDLFLKEIGNEKQFRCVDLDEGYDQTAVIICTSGTTDLPKCVCQSHANILNMLSDLEENTDICGICFSTLYWISGVLFLLLGTVRKFTRIITSKPYNPEDFIEIAKKYHVGIFLGSPSQMGLLVNCTKLQQNDLHSLKLVYLGGSPVHYSIVQKLQIYAPKATIIVGYGQTEICAAVSVGIAKENGNCGHLIANVEVKIIDENNKSLGPNEMGEICSRSACKWPGYYGNPEETANTLDADNWIHSGDLGYFNDKGELYVVDRKKDILKYNNYHFYPSEIETVILELNDVVEVCVFGVPDIIFTNLPAAAIVKKPQSKLTGEEVYDYVKQKMSHIKYLRGGVYFVKELPKTPSGKVLRRKVAELYKDYRQELLD